MHKITLSIHNFTFLAPRFHQLSQSHRNQTKISTWPPSCCLHSKLQKNNLNQSCLLLIISYHTTFQDTTLSGASVAPTSIVGAPAMFSLSIEKIKTHEFGVMSDVIRFIPNLIENRLVILEFKHTDRGTGRHGQLQMRSFYVHSAKNTCQSRSLLARPSS